MSAELSSNERGHNETELGFPRMGFITKAGRRAEYLSPNFKTFKEPKNWFQGTNSAMLCSLASQYNKPYSYSVPSPHRLFKNSSTDVPSLSFFLQQLVITGSHCAICRARGWLECWPVVIWLTWGWINEKSTLLWAPRIRAAYGPLHSTSPADDPYVQNDLSRTGLYTFVYSTRSVHMYCQIKVSILLLFVLITSYCVRVFYILVTPTYG